MAADFPLTDFWETTPPELQIMFKGVDRRLRREHNDRMTQAYWTAVIPHQKKPIALKDLLVDIDNRPKSRKPWQELKAVLMLAIGPGNPQGKVNGP